jgi:hypothetical protein
MASHSQAPKVFLAFRFHANFYHSYRGDTPDELGFGKDIRIIRKIIEVLDNFNADGVPARGTWDIENYFSLETIMPKHCPDIIESLQRRVAEGKDEVQVMSHNNGLISAHTASEFDDAVGRAITNDAGSGVRDIFGEFAPMVRPQEMMYTPMHLKLYPRHGIEYISHYDLDYGAFSRNQEMDSFNNHVTHGWVAVTDGERGMLVAQTADVNASLAFCPMRTRVTRRRTRVFLNPFGSYHGKQLHYPTAFTGLGKLIGTMMGESLDPLAPSYNGQSEEFSQLIAPYAGDEPPEQIRNDAEAFAYPYAVLSRSKEIQPPRHRQWTYRERGGGSGRSE